MPVHPKATANLAPALTYARLLRENHELIANGLGDSPAAEALAEEMDGPWHEMSDKEQQRMRGLSVDLYALHERRSNRVDMTKEQLVEWQSRARELFEQFHIGDLDIALAILRQPVPPTFSEDAYMYLRARCWDKLGDPDTALVFMRAAESHNREYAVSVLTLLQQAGRKEEEKEQAERIIAATDSSPLDLYLAATSLIGDARELVHEESERIIHRAHAALSKAVASLRSSTGDDLRTCDLDVSITAAIAFCQERLGDLHSAINTYASAVQRHPDNGDLYALRGLVLFDKDQKAALHDFVGAVRLGSKTIWAYHFLARHALAQGTYGYALTLATRATELPGPNTIRGQVYETIALAQAALAYPRAVVVENYERATRLDPENQQIRGSYEMARAMSQRRSAFEQMLEKVASPPPIPSELEAIRNHELDAEVITTRERHEAILGLIFSRLAA